jgi:8-oxo-dGTP pyrophosphatase MutT (NUDIX family)
MSGYTKGTSATREAGNIRSAFTRAISAIQAGPDPAQAFRDATDLGNLARQLSSQTADFRAYLAASLLDSNTLSIAQLASILGVSKGRADQLVRAGRKKGNTVTDPGTDPEPAAVAAAIITSDLGVLIERRNDKIPPWTFPAGEMLPGESPAETIIRRVPAETGIDVTPDHVIGRRIHPKTGRVMIYVLATTAGTSITLGDPDDLAEVKWASIAETRHLMPDMFPPVRAYLDDLAIQWD